MRAVGFAIIASTIIVIARTHGVDVSPWWIIPIAAGFGMMEAGREIDRDC